MFENLKLSEFTWSREPVLYVTLLVAVLQVVAGVIGGDLAVIDGVEAIITLVVGFVVRGQVSPVS